MALDTSRFDEIKQAASSRSDEDILNFARRQDGGIGGLLDEVFGNMPSAFRPDRAKGQQAEFQYIVETPDGPIEYFVRVRDGLCESGRGTVSNPQLTSTLGLPTFLRLATGRLNGMQAFLRGKVKLSGNTLFAAKFEHWFERPA